MAQSNRVFGLDLLRAVAISLVLIDHSGGFFHSCWPPWLFELAIQGAVGVDLFFVLSGFLIGGILLRDLEHDASPGSLLRFWSRRWWRTLPNYYLFFILNFVAMLRIWGHRPSVRGFPVFAQWLVGPRNLFFGEAWSLCVEEWFYLLFPALAFGAVAIVGRRSFLVAAIAVAAASFAGRAWCVLVRDCSIEVATWSTLLRLDSLMFGVVAAWLAARCPDDWRRWRRPAIPIGLALIAASIGLRLATDRTTVFSRLFYFDAVALGVALTLPWLSGWRRAGGWLEAVTTRVSLYSYSIYLVNYLLFSLMVRELGTPENLAVAIGMAGVWVAATIALSAICYHGYESRMTRLRDVDWRSLAVRAFRRPWRTAGVSHRGFSAPDGPAGGVCPPPEHRPPYGESLLAE